MARCIATTVGSSGTAAELFVEPAEAPAVEGPGPRPGACCSSTTKYRGTESDRYWNRLVGARYPEVRCKAQRSSWFQAKIGAPVSRSSRTTSYSASSRGRRGHRTRARRQADPARAPTGLPRRARDRITSPSRRRCRGRSAEQGETAGSSCSAPCADRPLSGFDELFCAPRPGQCNVHYDDREGAACTSVVAACGRRRRRGDLAVLGLFMGSDGVDGVDLRSRPDVARVGRGRPAPVPSARQMPAGGPLRAGGETPRRRRWEGVDEFLRETSTLRFSSFTTTASSSAVLRRRDREPADVVLRGEVVRVALVGSRSTRG